MPENETLQDLGLEEYKYDFADEEKHVFRTQRGLTADVVRQISAQKNEPAWMLEFRLKALEIYYSKPMPTWGGDLSDLERVLDDIYYYVRPQDKMEHSWEDVPENIKTTFERLGIPEAEQKILAGVGAQYESEMVYHSLKQEWEEQGVIFDSIEEGLKNHPDLFREYFGTVIPSQDNKFAAMNSAVWSGGSFVYIPKGVELENPPSGLLPCQPGEDGPVRADPHHCRRGLQRPLHRGVHGSGLLHRVVPLRRHRDHRQEECPLPVHDHPELVEQHVQPRHPAGHGARGRAHGVARRQPGLQAHHEVPVVLPGRRGRPRRNPLHRLCWKRSAPGHGWEGDPRCTPTTSSIVSKSISRGTGRSSYRGLCKVYEGATHSRSNVQCDALLINDTSRTDTYPYIEIEERDANVGHEATVSKVGEEQLFYLMSRGMSEAEAMALIVRGFIEPIAKELPLEYAVELNRLIDLEMEGSVG